MIPKSRFAELKLSRLMLGTVQFGLNYGIANKTGCPSYEIVRDIIACAYEAGVNCLDTAADYGTSEEVLGKVMNDLGIADKMIVTSKISHISPESLSGKEVNRLIEESVTRSLKRLRLKVLPVCLFHKEDNFRYVEYLLKLKDRGLIRHIGSSVMTTKAAFDIISFGTAEVIQIPANILDHRFIRQGIIKAAVKSGVSIFARSIYLQGLILMPEEKVPAELTEVLPVRRKLCALAEEAGMALSELAVRYALSIDGIACVLVGVDTVEQIRQNIKLFSKKPLEPGLIKSIDDIVPELSDKIVMPNKWPT